MDIIGYLPDYMRQYREIKEINNAETPEFKTVSNEITAMPYEFFVDTAKERGLERFEKILGITPSEDESLDYRRFRIKTRLSGVRQSVGDILASIMPNGGWSVEYDEQNFRLKVGLSLINKNYLSEAERMLDKLLPANIEMECALLHSTHGALSRFKHSQLKAYKHSRLIYSI